MMGVPKSLTAIVHVRFHYEDVRRTCGDGEPRRAELLSRLVERAADLSPELQKILEEFASQLNEVSNGKGQSPD